MHKKRDTTCCCIPFQFYYRNRSGHVTSRTELLFNDHFYPSVELSGFVGLIRYEWLSFAITLCGNSVAINSCIDQLLSYRVGTSFTETLVTGGCTHLTGRSCHGYAVLSLPCKL